MKSESTISFVKNWDLDILPTRNPWTSDAVQFTTIYDATSYEWRLSIVRDNSINFIYQPPDTRSSNVQLSLEPSLSSLAIRNHYALRCNFELRVKDSESRTILTAEPYCSSDSNPEEFTGFTVPNDSSLGLTLKSIFSADIYNGLKCHITATLFLLKSQFLIGSWSLACPLTSNQLDFRFTALTDKKRHDFCIKTLRDSREYPASREALYLCSSFFRKKLISNALIRDEIELDTSLPALTTVVTFAMTGTFLPPSKLTYQLTTEILVLSEQVDVINRKEFKQAIEKMACEQLYKEHSELRIILEWLLVARDLSLSRLENTASALIIRLYFKEFIREYGDNTRSHNRTDLHDRLHRSQRIFRSSAYARLQHLQRSSRGVYCIDHFRPNSSE